MEKNKVVNIAVIDDDPVIGTMIEARLSMNKLLKIILFETAEEFLKSEALEHTDVVVCDYFLDSKYKSAMDGQQFIEELEARNIALPVIMLSSQPSMDLAVDLLKKKVVDYIVKNDHFLDDLSRSLDSVLSAFKLNESKRTFMKMNAKGKERMLNFLVLFLIGLTIWIFFL